MSPEVDLGEERGRRITAYDRKPQPKPVGGAKEDKTAEWEVQEKASAIGSYLLDVVHRGKSEQFIACPLFHCGLFYP